MAETSFSLLERLRLPFDADAWARFVALYAPLIYAWGRGVGLQQRLDGPAQLRVAAGPETGWRSIMVCCVVAFFLTLVLAVAIQGKLIRAQERSDRIASRTAVELEPQRDLRVSVAEAESPGRILEAARALGMVEPGPIAAVPAGPKPTVTAQDSAAPGTTGASEPTVPSAP